MTLTLGQSIAAGPSATLRYVPAFALAALALTPAILAGLPGAAGGLTLVIFASFGLLATIVAESERLRRVLRLISWPAAAGMLALVLSLLALTPLAPGGANPLWLPLEAGAAVLDREAGLQGVVTLSGFLALFILAALLGHRLGAVTRMLQGLLVIAQVPGIAANVYEAHNVVTHEFTSPAPLAAFAGLTVILAAATLVRVLEGGRRSLPLSDRADVFLAMAMGSGSLVVLSALCGLGAIIAVLGALAAFAAWEYLSRGGERGLRPAPLLALSGFVGLTIAAIAALLIVGVGDPGGVAQRVSNGVHARMVWASPLMGYGPGSGRAVGLMAMDRLSLPALSASPVTSSGYLSALEQVGALGASSLVMALGLVVWTLAQASVRRRRSASLYRGAVGCVVFLALLAVTSPAPVSIAVLAPLTLLLGCAFGAATATETGGGARRSRARALQRTARRPGLGRP